MLEQEDTDAFVIFNTWLYTNKLLGAVGDDNIECDLTDLSRVYLLGDRYVVPELKNIVIDQVIVRIVRDKAYPFDLIVNLYNAIPNDDPMCKLLVDVFVWDEGNVLTNYMVGMPGHFPICFLENLVMAISERPNPYNPKAAPWRMRVCSSYHTHVNGANCES